MIKIKALDTVFFRDSKPFTKGEEVWADYVFPPMPSVIYGSLRTAYLASNTKVIKNKKLDTNEDLSSKLCIKGIFYGIESRFLDDDQIWLPLPLDLVKKKDQNDKSAYLVDVEKLDNILYDRATDYVLTSTENVESVSNGIISLESFKRYLKGEKKIVYKTLDEHIEIEPKIGIARDKTKTSKDENLYNINMIRPNDLVFYIDYEGIELPTNGLLKLGGQGKASYYTHKDVEISFNEEFDTNKKYFKLYLLTPGLFKNGWLPSIIDKDTKILSIGNAKARLLTAAIGKPKYISGFDLKDNKPKANLKVVPEGSVYYFELLEGSMKEIYNELNYKNICDMGESYINRGFGITIVGEVNL